MSDMLTFSVGKKCPIKCPEGAGIILDEDGFLFIFNIEKITLFERIMFRLRKINIKLAFLKNIAVFGFDIKGFIRDTELYFDMHLADHKSVDLYDFQEGDGYHAKVMLVEKTTGVIKDIRSLNFSTKMSKEFNKIAIQQLSVPFDEYNHNRNIDIVINNYTSEDMKGFVIANTVA